MRSIGIDLVSLGLGCRIVVGWWAYSVRGKWGKDLCEMKCFGDGGFASWDQWSVGCGGVEDVLVPFVGGISPQTRALLQIHPPSIWGVWPLNSEYCSMIMDSDFMDIGPCVSCLGGGFVFGM